MVWGGGLGFRVFPAGSRFTIQGLGFRWLVHQTPLLPRPWMQKGARRVATLPP